MSARTISVVYIDLVKPEDTVEYRDYKNLVVAEGVVQVEYETHSHTYPLHRLVEMTVETEDVTE